MAEAAAVAARGRPQTAACPVCNKSNPKFRCSKCRLVWYCSRNCQQQDWKVRHRHDCRAYQAHTELLHLLQSSTIDQAHEDYTKSVDYVEALKQQELNDAVNNKDLQQKQEEKKQQRVIIDDDAAGKQHPKPKPRRVTNPERNKATIRRRRRHSSANASTEVKPKVDFNIQHMPNLCCYQMILRRRTSDDQNAFLVEQDRIQTRLINHEDDNQILGERHTALFSLRRGDDDDDDDDVLTLRLPGKIHDTRAYSYTSPTNEQSTSTEAIFLSVRLSYDPSTVCDESFLPIADRPFLSIETPASAQTLACRSCNHGILNTATSGIDRILPLPSGRWDDIFPDYLMCYPGEPMIDIGSEATTAGVQEGCLLEDETMIVLHANHVIAPALSIPGYGEDTNTDLPSSVAAASISTTKDDDGRIDQQKLPLTDLTANIRGIRPWRDVVGGATITCQLCASVLGYAQESSCRIFKHRVGWNEATDDGEGDDDYDDNTTIRGTFTSLNVADFVVYEMIRYAETKAIFAFQILLQQNNGGGSSKKTKSLWLHLMSWDSRAATSKDCWFDKGVFQLEWHRMVQIMYEEIEQHDGSPSSKHNSSAEHLDWMAWTKDWCCPPDKEEKKGGETNNNNEDDAQQQEGASSSSSVVRLWLCPQEYESVRRALNDGSNFYSNEVKHATIAAKTGGQSKGNITRETLGLAALLLSS